MAITYTTRPNTYATGFIARLAVAATAIPQKFADSREIRQTVRTLRQLSDRQLNDIGLTPGDVDRMRG